MNHLTDQKTRRKTMNKEELVKVQRNFFDTTVQVKILTSANTYRQVVVKMLVYAENMISAKQVAEDWVIKKLELKDKFEIKNPITYNQLSYRNIR